MVKKKWLKEFLSDKYVKDANREGFRSRAAFKLLEINDEFGLFDNCSSVLCSYPDNCSSALCSYPDNCFQGQNQSTRVLLLLPRKPTFCHFVGENIATKSCRYSLFCYFSHLWEPFFKICSCAVEMIATEQ